MLDSSKFDLILTYRGDSMGLEVMVHVVAAVVFEETRK